MFKNFLTVHHIVFLLFLVLGQIQLGFGQYSDSVEDEGNIEHASPSFRAISSLFFRPGTDYNVFFTVNPHQGNEPLELKCVLMANSDPRSTIESESIYLRSGQSRQISIPLPRQMPGGESTWRLFTWSVTDDTSTTGYLSEAPHTLIVSSEVPNSNRPLTKNNLASVYVQTDKPAYKPDDLVRIRVVTMSSDDLPHLTAGVNLTITDSQRNVLKKWEQPMQLPESAATPSNVSTDQSVALFGEFQKKTNGLSAYEYQLSSEPILGNWTIEVEAGNIKEKVFFDVQKYILPKFQVKVKVPPVLYGTGDITTSATVQVSYTYGKGLEGTGTLTVTSDNNTTVKIQQLQVQNGDAVVPLTFSSSRASSAVHTITANVTEKNTGRWQIGTTTVRIFPQETYSIFWINKQSSYKPGLPMNVQLKITGQDGFPVTEVRPNALRITFPSSFREMSIPLSGVVAFSFPTPLEPLPANTKFTVQYQKTTQELILPPAQALTASGILIDVVPPADSARLIQGKSYDFTIQSNRPIQPELFHCLLWDDAAMEVRGAQLIRNSHNRPATEFPFSVQIPKGAYRELKIFVYFTMTEGDRTEIISTSKSINTHNYLKIRVSQPTSRNDGSAGVRSTLAPSPGRTTVATTTRTTTAAPRRTTTTATTTTTTEAEDDAAYEYDEEDFQRDDSGASDELQSLSSDELEVAPGDAVEIHFETCPDSTIAIRGIDQSLLLLTQQDNGLDPEKIQNNRLTTRLRASNLDNIPTDNPSFLRTFHRLGISVLISTEFTPFAGHGVGATIAGLLSHNRSEASPEIEEFDDGNNSEENELDALENAVFDDERIPQVDSRLRTKFPETWLWEEFQSSNDNSTTILSKTLPDTLTSWIISGFSLNPKTGLGIASPATITGFMPFFVTLNLPYAVIKQETFDLQVIVHNYLDRDVNVFVTLFNKQNSFSFIDSREIRRGVGNRYVKVKKNHAAVAHFVITPNKIGDIPIEVKAVTEDGTAADSMLRPLKVKPDGVRQSKTQLVMFSKTKSQNPNLTPQRFEVEFPRKVVAGASSVQLTVIGDPMGTMISNLGHLLQIPSGCGEQNMMAIVPNILALHYLTAKNSDAEEIMQEAKKNLETGYSQQLRYQMPDGSFGIYSRQQGIWQHNEAQGTVWLTSLVLRWFVVAQKYITVDDNVIRRAINFIRTKQQPNGLFGETGSFYHREMARADGVALTAYITLSLIKANETSAHNDLDLKLAIENGMNFISRNSVYQLEDNYITNLVTATLVAGNHPDQSRFIEKMERAANTGTTKEGVKVKYWDMMNSTERASDPLAIEMTSYALLAHLWRPGQMDGSVLKIYKWLLNQRNPQGGFISTQDTNMGITALTEFALKTKRNVRNEDELRLNIQASSNSRTVKDTEFSVSVGRWNRMVLQEFNLPVSTKVVNVTARGSGPAFIQLTQTWNVAIKTRITHDDFNITAKMVIPDPEEPNETELTFCVNFFHSNGAQDSIASVELPSGYAFDLEDFDEGSEFMANRPTNVERFETPEGNSKVEVYYSSIPAHPPTCLTLVASRLNDVASAKRVPIVVYEYLDPEVKGTVAYLPAHRITVCDLCESTGACDQEGCS